MAGEMRDSFRQAMSEMFMGDNPKNKKAEARQEDAHAAPMDSPEFEQAPQGEAAVGRSTTIRHVEQSPAEAQLSRMSRGISDLEPNFDLARPAPAPAPTTPTSTVATAPVAATTASTPAADARPSVTAVPAGRSDGAESTVSTATYVSRGEGTTLPEDEAPVRSSIIAEGTEITGEVKFGSNAEVYGVLNAKVMSENDIITNMGSIVGDVVAKNLDMLNAKITGDVATYGDLRLSDASILTGDVAATRMDLRGQLIGNSAVRREINVHSTARLAGDVEAGSIAIGHGAKVRGYINVGFDDE